MKHLKEIQAFCLVAEKKSFIAAAHQLRTSPSSITRTIQALEEELGVILLVRAQKHIVLTLAGETYYDAAKHILQTHEEAQAQLSQLSSSPRGLVRFSAPEIMASHFLPEVLTNLSYQHPGLRFDIIYSDTILEPTQEKLDFSIRGAFPASSELIGYPLWKYKRHLYASPRYLEKYGTPTTPEELLKHKIIQHSAPRVLKAWNFQSPEHQCSMNLQATLRLSSGPAILHAVMAGAGISRLADWLAAPLIAQNKLIQLCPSYDVVSAKGDDPLMHAVFHNRKLPSKTRLVLEFIRQSAIDNHLAT